MTPTIAPPKSPTSDVQELVARVAELERAQRAEDVEATLALFDENAVWVTGGGVRLIGYDAISAFTRQVLPGAFAGDLSVRYDVEHLSFITPDVVLTGVNQEYLTADGRPLSPPQVGRPSYVWRRRDGQWFIAVGQNTTAPASTTDAEGARSPDEVESTHADQGQAAVRSILADIEHGFNVNDPELMMRHIASDALVANALGTVLRGRDEIDSATRAGLARGGALHAATAHYRLTDVTLLSADIAVAHKNAWATPSAADAGEPPEMNALYVLERRDGRWWIIRRQNTLVQPAAVT
ncbi:SgcJ/EcaC family oxidoreductase [Frankia sp. CcI49]|uniref:SgcJ/EcaC family oxidoreductase n=1 Tax=Frankia sp. CcI49 TaxID=1745382 RepID=UPI0018E9D409|nr:SgcJ/EcaC family oxidoreductase [Frankia sp. CcI49]